MTVLEVIQRSTEFLAKKGVDSPRLQVELLLAHVLGMPRLKLYLNFERTLSDAELEQTRALIKRRGQREPLQHILGSACFCGLDIAVSSDVLVPRPETELLAERAWTFLLAFLEPERRSPTRRDTADPKPQRAGSEIGAPIAVKFMAPMRDSRIVGASHEPAGDKGFESPPHTGPLPLGGGEGVRRTGENTPGPNSAPETNEPVGGGRARHSVRAARSGEATGRRARSDAPYLEVHGEGEPGFAADQRVQTEQGPFHARPVTVLDFGTGSGCVAIAIAVNALAAEVHAVDISAAAIRVARENAARHGVVQRIHFHEGDGFAALPDGLTFDLLVANPPYIPSAEIDTLEPEVRDHDPRAALDGGPDGLDFFRRLADEAASRLRLGGRLMLEFGDGQAEALCSLFVAHGWRVEGVERDYTGRQRFFIASASQS